MGRSNLQGTPWHYESATSKKNSKNCLYHDRKVCKYRPSVHYGNPCVGNSECDDFESRSGTPRVYNKTSLHSKPKSDDSTSTKENHHETKSEKFIRLAQKRTESIAKEIKLLSNLSNKSNYSYNQEQVDKIFSYIEYELQRARNKFEDDFKQFKL